jgi:hypothetical protein
MAWIPPFGGMTKELGANFSLSYISKKYSFYFSISVMVFSISSDVEMVFELA